MSDSSAKRVPPPARPGPGTVPIVREWYFRNRYSILFVTLLGTLIAAPLRGWLPGQTRLLPLFVALNLVAAASGITGHPIARRVMLVVAGAVAVAAYLGGRLGLPALAAVADVAWVGLAVLAAIAAVRFALGSGTVDREQVFAALSAYLLFGLIFAVTFLLIESARPGAVVDLAGNGEPLTLDTAIYLSYVTLATLGYGDVVPRDPTARGLAVVEALGAQLYLTVTVARLVALHVQSSSRPGGGRPESD